MLICVLCFSQHVEVLEEWRRKVRAVEIWGGNREQSEECSCLSLMLFYSREEIAETKGEDFLGACRFEIELLLAVLC